MLLKIVLIILLSLAAVVGLIFAYLAHLVNRTPKVKAGGIRVACVGDSITQGMGVLFDHVDRNSYPALLQGMLGGEYQVLNFGHSARTLLDSGDHPYRKSHFFAASLASDPAIVLILLGSNDSKPYNWNAAEYERQLAELVETYKALPGRPSVYLMTPPPAFVVKGKKKVAFDIQDDVLQCEIVPTVKRVAERSRVPTIDLFAATQEHAEYFPDGVHPNAAGDKVIAQTVYAALKVIPLS